MSDDNENKWQEDEWQELLAGVPDEMKAKLFEADERAERMREDAKDLEDQAESLRDEADTLRDEAIAAIARWRKEDLARIEAGLAELAGVA